MSTDVAIREQFEVGDPEVAASLADALKGASADDLEIPRVKVPGSGGTAWQIPTGVPDEYETTTEIVGVVIDQYSTDVLYLDEFDGSSNAPDALFLEGQFVYANERAIEAGIIAGLPTADQPLNEYGTGKNGGRAIDNKWRLFIVRPGEFLPLSIDLPVMSRKNWVNFNVMQISGRGRKLTQSVVKLGLKQYKNKGGIAYSQVIPEFVALLDDDQADYFAAQAASFKPLTRRQPSGDSAENAVDHAPVDDSDIPV